LPEEKLQDSVCVTFKDNTLLPMLFGEQDKHLEKLEKQLGVNISSRGNVVSISGDPKQVYISESVLKSMYHKLQNGMEVPESEFDALVRMISEDVKQGTVPIDLSALKIKRNESQKETPAAPERELSLKEPPTKQHTKGEDGMAHDGDRQNRKPPLGVVNPREERRMREEDRDEEAKARVGRPEVAVKTQRKTITPYSNKQVDYIQSLMKNEVVFAAGPAGTGKTYVAVSVAVSLFLSGEVDRIILTRPAVEAGEKLGFLPGDLKEKVDPYLRPLYDALYDMMPAEKVLRCVENGEIEIAPLAFMRGRTLRYSFVILDEAQNTTPTQMKMFLTRLGEGSRMAITGDLSQTDLPKDIKSGLRDAMDKLKNIEEIKMIRFSDADIVRHPLTVKIVQAYESTEKKWE
jgi:phosphate starvation-inducible PhoH-like protein